MAKAAWNRTIVDASGNVLPGADITVTDERTGTLATLFDDREGNDAKSNPFVADSNGFARFFADAGVYRVVAESGALSRTWRYQSVLDSATDNTWTGEQTFTDKVTMTDELEVDGDLEVTGDVEIGGNADITGNADIGGDVDITGKLDVTGDATMQLMSWYPRTRTVTGNTTATADDMVINVNAATATITIPSGLATGKRILVRKINAAQGAVTLARSGSEVFTRASLTSVALNADGDFWLIEKVSSTRWELLAGCETGSNGDGEYKRYANGFQKCSKLHTFTEDIITSFGANLFRSTIDNTNYPKTFFSLSYRNVAIEGGQPMAFRNNAFGSKFLFGNTGLDSRDFLRWRDWIVISSGPASDVNGFVHLYAEGRWYE